MAKIDYSKLTSGIIQRGEMCFPIAHMGKDRWYFKIKYHMDAIPKGGERLMTREEVLELYD